MIGINEIKTGKKIIWQDEPYLVMSHEHSKTGRAGAVLRTKLMNLLSGAIVDYTFQGAEKVDEAEIAKGTAQYLYHDGSEYYFMNQEDYEQFGLTSDVLGDASKYLIEGTEVEVLNWNGRAINVELPVKMTFLVVEAPPNLKGDTASGGDKVVTLENGLTVTAPLFIESGDRIIINTEKGNYVSRA